MTVPDLTAEGSGYYRVYVDGVEVSQHTTERKAIQRAMSEREANPEAVVLYDHDYRVSVGAAEEVVEPEPEPEPEPTPDLADRPNEPDGQSIIMDWNCGLGLPPWHTNTMTAEDCLSVEGLYGGGRRDWSGASVEQTADISLDVDETAPVSGPEVMRARLAQGLLAGQRGTRETIHVGGEQAPCSHGPGRERLATLYLAWWDRTEAPDHEVRGVNSMKIFGSFGLDGPERQAGSATLQVSGIQDQDYVSEFGRKCRIIYETADGGRENQAVLRERLGLSPIHRGYWNGPNPDHLQPCGEWVRHEVLARVNSIAGDGTPNLDGLFRQWTNGVLVLDWQDVVWRSFGDVGFTSLWMNWSYGGGDMSTTKERDDFWLTDSVYMSGTPLETP